MEESRASPESTIDVEGSTVLHGDPALAPTQSSSQPSPTSQRREFPPALAERYEDIQFLGKGGMGTVYRARDPRLGRSVALKVLNSLDAELGRRFLQEARAQAKIQHEHVCRVYEAGEVDGEPFIAMQYIRGEPLSMMADRLTLEQRVKVMREVSAAVHEAHRLGVIHRDLKPGNILCEIGADGSLKPYVMDFGLAKEVADRGQTVTGAVLGTPAYMSPEQAKGDVGSMDRRSDVYSLGATLYDIVAGHPPFVAPHAWKLLMMVAFEDPPPLGRVKKGLPEDLETIVMKCLEREPGRRYDSARALAEDLQRFLDGEPILGRRASLGYVLWKKAKKHKLVTGLAGLAVVSALGVGGVWVNARREAAAVARIAAELGANVKEMELFLRAAYELPLHDVERERDVVRRKLDGIEQRMRAAGRVGEGPGHYALGRGHLALGDPEKARGHLEEAMAAGYRSPELEYALGRTLGELYRRALEETKRVTNKAEREKRQAKLAAALRDPALEHLRAAAGTEIEAPSYVEGLIALYEGKNEEAVAKAREAFEKAPWMYEAKKLEGDALFAEGSKYRHDAAFDFEKMMASFGPAAEAYAIAARMGESDPEVYRADCELWEKEGWGAGEKGASMKPALEKAGGACDRAVQASSKDGRARVQRALVLSARLFAMRGETGEDAARAAEAAVRAAEESVAMSPQDVMAHYAMARALHLRAGLLESQGKDASMEPAIAAFERVLELDPNFTWAVNELGLAYLAAARTTHSSDQDVVELGHQALKQFDRAISLDPTFTSPVHLKVQALAVLVHRDILHGRAEEAPIVALTEALTSLERRDDIPPSRRAFWKARVGRLRAHRELVLGRDPRPSTQSVLDVVDTFDPDQTRDPYLRSEVACCHYLNALHAIANGLDPKEAVAAARQATSEAVKLRGTLTPDLRELAAEIDLIAIRVAVRRGDASAKSFDEALTQILPLLSKERKNPKPYQIAAEIHAWRASWAHRNGRRSQDDVTSGLLLADEALSMDPHMVSTFAAKGLLYLARARASQEDAVRSESARQAKAALESAFREDRSLELEHRRTLQEVLALL